MAGSCVRYAIAGPYRVAALVCDVVKLAFSDWLGHDTGEPESGDGLLVGPAVLQLLHWHCLLFAANQELISWTNGQFLIDSFSTFTNQNVPGRETTRSKYPTFVRQPVGRARRG
jgi:hypothetical protein